MKICVITDNDYLYKEFRKIISLLNEEEYVFDFFYSLYNRAFKDKYKNSKEYVPILLKNESEDFFRNYELFISLHCKQIFPDKLVRSHKCINIHPGLNPYNRGWFPHVFSIINKKKAGVTIHEMDDKLDHGDIIVQKEVIIEDYETSADVYKHILELELNLLSEYLPIILKRKYTTISMCEEGNLNLQRDYNELCKLKMDSVYTMREVIDLLRALTHPPYRNAYFYNDKGEKINVSIILEKENNIKD